MLTPLAPHKREQAIFPMPCVKRWKVSHTNSKAQKSISTFRRDLDKIMAAQVEKIFSLFNICFVYVLVLFY